MLRFPDTFLYSAFSCSFVRFATQFRYISSFQLSIHFSLEAMNGIACMVCCRVLYGRCCVYVSRADCGLWIGRLESWCSRVTKDCECEGRSRRYSSERAIEYTAMTKAGLSRIKPSIHLSREACSDVLAHKAISSDGLTVPDRHPWPPKRIMESLRVA